MKKIIFLSFGLLLTACQSTLGTGNATHSSISSSSISASSSSKIEFTSSSQPTKNFFGSIIPITWSTWQAGENLSWSFADYLEVTNNNEQALRLTNLDPMGKLAVAGFSESAYAGMQFITISTKEDLSSIKNSFKEWSLEKNYGKWEKDNSVKNLEDSEVWISPDDWIGGGSKYYFISLKNSGAIVLQNPSDPNEDFAEGIKLFFENWDL